MKIKSITQKRNWQGKRVFLRVDFNVSQKNGKIIEDYRITSALKTISYLVERGARLVVATHWGDPSSPDSALSARPLASRLAKLSGLPVKFIPFLSGPKVEKAVLNLLPGKILFLENLRSDAGEKSNSLDFAESLAKLADVYVNDAFSVCHRDQASVSALAEILPAYAGLQLSEEIRNLEKIKNPCKPLVLVMGGSKISTKAPIISKLYTKSSAILLGGGLANAFCRREGWEIGRSLADDKRGTDAFYRRGKLLPKIILPIDAVVRDISGEAKLRKPKEIKKSDAIFDIGPDSIALFSGFIRQAKTIVWNGPLGVFEEEHYKHGTMAIASMVAARSKGKAFGLVGGGETVAALKLSKMEKYVDWVSTAGGAMLAYLGGEKMPGLKKIIF